VAWASHAALAAALPGRGLGTLLALAFGPILAAGLAYLGAARLLGVAELTSVVGVLRRRAKRPSATPARR
jgi:hypothetical protein